MTEYMPQDKPATFIKKIFQGILIGFGCILPGVSGGVIAVSFGLYRSILDGLAGLRRAFFRNFLWLLPLGLGGVAGLLAGAFLLNELLALYTVPLLALFIGLILGCTCFYQGGQRRRLPSPLSAGYPAAGAACLQPAAG